MKNKSRIFTNDNCTGCNRCIEACTVPEANIASITDGKNEITVDDDHCIKCGKCIEVCPHDAREYLDDTEVFLKAIKQGKKISALVAPAVRTNFPDYKKFIGFLKDLGVENVYDVSFGADICTWGYIRYLQKNKTKGMISQPCPAVVNHIEKHDPDLIKKLVPVQSPVMCAAIYMRKYEKIRDELVFISPCIAKSDEINDDNTHKKIQYNVTFQKLFQLMESTGIDYTKYKSAEFDNKKHNLGSLYPMPGGLKKNVLHFIPGSWVYQVEGQPDVRHFLDQYQKSNLKDKELPFLVDILNCSHGCNLGTGSLTEDEDALDVDRIMYEETNSLQRSSGLDSVKNSRKREIIKEKSLSYFDDNLDLNDFLRTYSNKFVEPVNVTSKEKEDAFLSMKKITDDDRKINCCSCGFSSCENMALAISRGINHPENCVEYHKKELEEKQSELQRIMEAQEQRSNQLKDGAHSIYEKVQSNSELTTKANHEVEVISAEMEKINEMAQKLRETVEVVNNKLQYYKEMGTEIVDISTMSKLLSLNASVEAANAGNYGKGFGVVAEEMQKLSEQTSDNAKVILEQNEEIFPLLDDVKNMNDQLNKRIEAITSSTEDILEAVQSITEREIEINDTASNLHNGE